MKFVLGKQEIKPKTNPPTVNRDDLLRQLKTKLSSDDILQAIDAELSDEKAVALYVTIIKNLSLGINEAPDLDDIYDEDDIFGNSETNAPYDLYDEVI